MNKKSEPLYIHVVLYLVIAILAYILIRVAIIDPTDYVEKENYYTNESHLRMENIRQAELLWEKKHKGYTDKLDSLIYFIKHDAAIQNLINGEDTLTGKSTNPFKSLTSGKFVPDSLMFSVKTNKPYILQVDTTTQVDTVINRYGRITRVDTSTVIGSLFYLECPDGFGTIGDLKNIALKHTASWE